MAERICVVDDSETIRQVAREVLSDAGYTVDVASSGEEALRRARRRPPAAFVIDVAMPGMSGLALCRELAADPHFKQAPVVLLIAKGDPLIKQLEPHVRESSLLFKPFSPEALRQALTRALEATRPGASQPPAKRTAGWAERIAAAPASDRDALLEGLLKELGLEPGVSLFGDLGVVGAAELFQMFALQGQTGLLTVKSDRLDLEIYFQDGKIDFVHAKRIGPALLLGRILVAEGLAGKEEIEQFLRYRRAKKLLGQELVQLGFVTLEELREALARQSSELIYELLRARAGSFAFVRGAERPPYAAEFQLSLSCDALLMEGYRRVDELQLVEDELGTRQAILRQDQHALERFGHQNLTPPEQEVLALCDGRRSIDGILYAATRGTFDTLKILYRLIQSRLVYPAET